ncbi:hypothetical protein FRC06_003555, partial [Ceratobasidium sp. 370]
MIGNEGAELCVQMLDMQQDRGKHWDDNTEGLLALMMSKDGKKLSGVLSGAADDSRPTGPPTEACMKQYWTLYIAQGSINLAKQVVIPIMIRCSRGSKAPDGQTVLNLPPLVEVVAWSPLRDDELAARRLLDEELQENLLMAKTLQPKPIVWK